MSFNDMKALEVVKEKYMVSVIIELPCKLYPGSSLASVSILSISSTVPTYRLSRNVEINYEANKMLCLYVLAKINTTQ